MKKYFIKAQNLIIYLLSRIIVFFIFLQSQEQKSDTLLLIRLDLIGDYILFRNFIGIIKQHYKNYKITLCGNIIWKDLSELLDSNEVTNFIWIDRKKFYGNLFYKVSILNKIHKEGFEIVINPTFTREMLYGDMMVLVSKAKERIGSSGSPDKHARWKRNLLTDKYYTKLISADDQNTFEFYRNKEFIEKVIKQKMEITKPSLPFIKGYKRINKNFVLFVPGASEVKRQWSINNYVKVGEYILNNSDLEIIIAGSSSEKHLAKEYLKNLESSNDRITDKTGKTLLSEFVGLIAESEFLISNETSSIHIAAALGKPFICISNGNHFGRFNPYPENMIKNSYYIYTEEIANRLNKPEELIKQYRFDSNLDVNSISSDKIIKVIMSILAKHNLK